MQDLKALLEKIKSGEIKHVKSQTQEKPATITREQLAGCVKSGFENIKKRIEGQHNLDDKKK